MACTTSCVFPTPAQAHCPACHHTFSGVWLFDRHRFGPVQDRCCYSPGAIPNHPAALDRRGVWRSTERRPDGIGRSAVPSDAQTA